MSTGPRTTAATVETKSRRGVVTYEPIYVSGGAVRQDGSLKLYTCNTCHREVVWAKSTRTGRAYLVNVYRGASDARYYNKASAHECQPPIDIPAGPNDALLRGLKQQLDMVEQIRAAAAAEDNEALYEEASDKHRKLRRQVREIEGR